MCSSILYKDSVFLFVNIQYNPEPDFYRYPLCINNVSAQITLQTTFLPELPSSKRKKKYEKSYYGKVSEGITGKYQGFKKKASPFFGLPVDAVDRPTYE